jgi:hypothetical protein
MAYVLHVAVGFIAKPHMVCHNFVSATRFPARLSSHSLAAAPGCIPCNFFAPSGPVRDPELLKKRRGFANWQSHVLYPMLLTMLLIMRLRDLSCVCRQGPQGP